MSKKMAKKLMRRYMYTISKNNAFDKLKCDHVISCHIYKWKCHIQLNFVPLEELELLHFQTSILLKLRSGHVELNSCKHITKPSSIIK